MKIRYIEAFRAMMECGTVSAAARALRISQPAMTKLIAQLQAELDLVLFAQQGGRLAPTAEAHALAGSMNRAWRGVMELKEAAEDVRDMRSGRLTIAAFPSFAQAVMPGFIAQFVAAAPRSTIALHSQPSLRVIDWTADGQADLGIAAVLAPRPGVHVEPLGKLSAVCALPVNHRLAQRDVIHARDLRDEAFISLADVDRSRSRIEAAFEPDAVERDIRLTTPQSTLALALVANGVGASVIDDAAASLADPAKVAIRRFVPAVSFDIYLYHPANREPSQLYERFVREFRRWFRSRRKE
ncbi:MAG: LysR family transcriptional regulator [Burkholderiaceae bacterium]|nr:LysR family transcriptional regulator [Burkholderiaceae bacterium]